MFSGAELFSDEENDSDNEDDANSSLSSNSGESVHVDESMEPTPRSSDADIASSDNDVDHYSRRLFNASQVRRAVSTSTLLMINQFLTSSQELSLLTPLFVTGRLSGQ